MTSQIDHALIALRQILRATEISSRALAIDKRRVTVVLTEQGAAILENAPSILQQRFERGFEKLEGWEQSFLVAGLERTVALLDAEELDAAPVLDVGSIGEPTD